MILADFPKIRLSITTDDGSITSTRLSLDTAFYCETTDDSILNWLRHYAERRTTLLQIPLYLENLSPFQKKVLQRLLQIPLGSTESYGAVAHSIGNPKAARAIGGACNKNPIPFFIPCHRVIASDKTIGGFSIDLEIKRRLLEFESGQTTS